MKRDLAILKRMPTQSLPVETQYQFSHELKNLRQEVSSIQSYPALHSSPSIAPSDFSPLKVAPEAHANYSKPQRSLTTYKCRGLKNSNLYLNHLLEAGTDIIAVTEHWLWPYQLHMLQDVHPSYEGFGRSNNRLNENSDLVRGCGGVGIIWKKSLRISPVISISSDRLCAVRLFISDTDSINIGCIYLPSSDHCFEAACGYRIQVVFLNDLG